MIQLPPGPFTTVMADPPWPYKDANSETSTLARSRGNVKVNDWTYAPMPISSIKAIGVRSVTSTPSHLYLWFTNAFAVEAHEVARAWGYEPKTIITWGKVKMDDPNVPSMKTGYYFRGATEHMLFAVRGSMKTIGAHPTLILTHRLAHSVKPDEAYALVESASPGPYLEMFARRSRDGWQSWGDQVDKSAVLPSAQTGPTLQPSLFAHV